MVGDWDGAGCWRALIRPSQAISHVEFTGNTRNPSTPGIVYAGFTQHTREQDQPPSIVGTLLVRVLYACPRPIRI